MKLQLQRLLAVLVVLVALNGSVFAPHDRGLGKSQDHPQDNTSSGLTSIATAPEPVTGVLFLAGAGLVALRLRTRGRAE